MEIYVATFPSVKWQVSCGGGQEPRWRQDGKELFYVSTDGKMMSVGVTTGASFKAGAPVTLFQTHRRQPISAQGRFFLRCEQRRAEIPHHHQNGRSHGLTLYASQLGFGNGEVAGI